MTLSVGKEVKVKNKLKITVDLEKAVKEQINYQIERELFKIVTDLKGELYERAEKIAKEITPKYSKQVIKNIEEWIKK